VDSASPRTTATSRPQVVIAMAVTRDAIPVRCWSFPDNESDQRIIGTIKDDLGAWNPAPADVVRRRRVRLGRQPRRGFEELGQDAVPAAAGQVGAYVDILSELRF